MGMVRNVDSLGRIVIPIELRRKLGIEVNDTLEFYVDDTTIKLKKYFPSRTCMVTGKNSDNNLSLLNGKLIISPEVAEQIMNEMLKKTS